VDPIRVALAQTHIHTRTPSRCCCDPCGNPLITEYNIILYRRRSCIWRDDTLVVLDDLQNMCVCVCVCVCVYGIWGSDVTSICYTYCVVYRVCTQWIINLLLPTGCEIWFGIHIIARWRLRLRLSFNFGGPTAAEVRF